MLIDRESPVVNFTYFETPFVHGKVMNDVPLTKTITIGFWDLRLNLTSSELFIKSTLDTHEN